MELRSFARSIGMAVALVGCSLADAPARAPRVALVEARGGLAPRLAANLAEEPACPLGMVLVEGGYCPDVEQYCLRFVDKEGPFQYFRCAEYASSRCKAERVHLRFCIDREEYAPPGEDLPIADQSWTSAGALCAARGGRLCLESEWQFACEGEDMHPYPYGDGLHRDAAACNIDRRPTGRAIPMNGGVEYELYDLREPAASRPACVSPFGVHGMSGNVEEWATRDRGVAPERSAMKGAWWLPGKNTCRAVTTGHGENYRGKQVGVRCCRDADGPPAAPAGSPSPPP